MILKTCFTSEDAPVKQGLEENKQEMPWAAEKVSIYEGLDSNDLFEGIKRRLFFQTLQSIVSFHKHAWAKQTVIQTLKTVYLDK